MFGLSNFIITEFLLIFYSLVTNVLYSYRNSLRKILRRLCEYKGVKIIEGELMADYVHMLVLILSKISVSSFLCKYGRFK